MKFNPDEMYQLVSTIWETALGLHIEPEARRGVGNDAHAMAACIRITGAWNGAIVLDCPVEVARLAASVMFGAAQASVTNSDLRDAVAELVNMIGGNFKALLPGRCYLSLPATVQWDGISCRLPDCTELGRLAVTCEGHVMSIAVLACDSKVAFISQVGQ